MKATEVSLRVARAVSRAQIVLLSSHFERYLYTVNEEAVVILNGNGVNASNLSETLKLLHSRMPIDDMAETGWENRTKKLSDFVAGDSWLWSTNASGILSHDRLLVWMTAPKPANLLRYYRYWGIQDIFQLITRTPTAQMKLWLGVQELVDLRNLVAHGDISAKATQSDIRRYIDSVRTFCMLADRRLARVLANVSTGGQPW
jgi:hypothetical protein